MNILIKLTCLVGLAIAPILGEMYNTGTGDMHAHHGPAVSAESPASHRVMRAQPESSAVAIAPAVITAEGNAQAHEEDIPLIIL